MRVGKIRVNLTDRNSEKTIALFGEYVKCERINEVVYDVIVKNERFHDVDPLNIPYYQPVIMEKANGLSRGVPSVKRYVGRFKRLKHAPC